MTDKDSPIEIVFRGKDLEVSFEDLRIGEPFVFHRRLYLKSDTGAALPVGGGYEDMFVPLTPVRPVRLRIEVLP